MRLSGGRGRLKPAGHPIGLGDEAALAAHLPDLALEERTRTHGPGREFPALGADELAAHQAPPAPRPVYVIQLAVMTHTHEALEPARAFTGALPASRRAQMHAADRRQLCGGKAVERLLAHEGVSGAATLGLRHRNSLRSSRVRDALRCT